MIVVVPGVGPEQDPPSMRTCFAPRGGANVAPCGKTRERALCGDAGEALDQRTGQRAGEDGVGERGSDGAPAGKLVGESEDVVMERVEAAFVALGQELRFVCGEVNLHRALGLAGLATQAEIEGLMDGVALEALVAQVSGEHLPEQVSAAAR